MKLIFEKIFTVFLVLTVLVFASCSQIANGKGDAEQGMAVVKFSIDGMEDDSARTILPTYPESEITDIEIYYDIRILVAKYNTYAEFKNASITLPVGTYSFSIKMKNNGLNLDGNAYNVAINSGGNNVVTFSLVNSYGKLRIDFTNYNAIGATSFRVKVDSSTSNSINFSDQTYFEEKYNATTSITSKLVTVTFYNSSSKQVGIYTTYVQILTGAISKETVDLSKLTTNILLYGNIEVAKNSFEVRSFILSKQSNVKLSFEPDGELYCYLADKSTYDTVAATKDSWNIKEAPDGTIDSSGKTDKSWTTTKTLPAGTYYVIVKNGNVLMKKSAFIKVETVQ